MQNELPGTAAAVKDNRLNKSIRSDTDSQSTRIVTNIRTEITKSRAKM